MENQRVRLSKTMLKSALLQLLKEKPLNQITIYEICETAQINRTTFYKYYGSQADLLAEIEEDFFAQLNEDMKDILGEDPHALTSVLGYLYEQRETFCILVKAIPARDFMDHLFQVPSIRKIFQHLGSSGKYTDVQAKYTRQFVLQGTLAILCDWLESEDPEPVEEIAGVFELLRSKL